MKNIALGVQHLFTMFGATVVVPFLTGIPVSVALFTSGTGTLVFHLITGRQVPAYLGSSFAFIAPILAVTSYYAAEGDQATALAYATGGIMCVGPVYMLFAWVVRTIGMDRVSKVFTPLISGTMIMLIGLILAPVAIEMASENWILALVAIATMVITKLYLKGFASMLPVLTGIFAGYLVALLTGNISYEFSGYISFPAFQLPRFSLYALSIILPAAIAPAIEHIGDIYAISMVTEKPYYKKPGMHRTLFGDGLATAIAGLLGGPANTTYSENTGVLAFTGAYNPVIMRIAAVFAIVMSFVPAVEAAIMSIPQAVMGGVTIILFGMIAAVGANTLVKNQVILHDKNIILMSLMLIAGLGGAVLAYGSFSLQGLGLAAVVGVAGQMVLRGGKTA